MQSRITAILAAGITTTGAAASLIYWQSTGQEKVFHGDEAEMRVRTAGWIPKNRREQNQEEQILKDQQIDSQQQQMHANYRKKDKFEYNLRLRPSTIMNPQKVTYHLSLKGKHDVCGHIYEKAASLDDANHLETLQFLYDSCIMNQVDVDVNSLYNGMGIKADRVTHKLTDQLVPQYETQIRKDRLDRLQTTREFTKLKRGEQMTGTTFHQMLQSQVNNHASISDHLFYRGLADNASQQLIIQS